MSDRTKQLADRLRKNFAGPMTEGEIAFLRDVQGFIEFAIRNGLSFAVVASTLGHDHNELLRDVYDLDEAKARGFKPKVSGYSKISEEDFGDSEAVSE